MLCRCFCKDLCVFLMILTSFTLKSFKNNLTFLLKHNLKTLRMQSKCILNLQNRKKRRWIFKLIQVMMFLLNNPKTRKKFMLLPAGLYITKQREKTWRPFVCEKIVCSREFGPEKVEWIIELKMVQNECLL